MDQRLSSDPRRDIPSGNMPAFSQELNLVRSLVTSLDGDMRPEVDRRLLELQQTFDAQVTYSGDDILSKHWPRGTRFIVVSPVKGGA